MFWTHQEQVEDMRNQRLGFAKRSHRLEISNTKAALVFAVIAGLSYVSFQYLHDQYGLHLFDGTGGNVAIMERLAVGAGSVSLLALLACIASAIDHKRTGDDWMQDAHSPRLS